MNFLYVESALQKTAAFINWWGRYSLKPFPHISATLPQKENNKKVKIKSNLFQKWF
jgi:hypothetical protein